MKYLKMTGKVFFAAFLTTLIWVGIGWWAAVLLWVASFAFAALSMWLPGWRERRVVAEIERNRMRP